MTVDRQRERERLTSWELSNKLSFFRHIIRDGEKYDT